MVIPKINFPIYGIIILLSGLIGLIYILYNLKKEGYRNKKILLYFCLYSMFALVFGKMYTILIFGRGNIITATLSSYGGLFGVVLAAIIFEKIIPTNKTTIKYTILSLPLVYGLSKIACSLVGCCSGIPYKGIFKVKYLNELNIWQFPVQILEVIVFIILFIILHILKNKKYINYITILLVVTFKFLLDFLRYDHIDTLITKNQIFSIVLFVITTILFIITVKKKTRIL